MKAWLWTLEEAESTSRQYTQTAGRDILFPLDVTETANKYEKKSFIGICENRNFLKVPLHQKADSAMYLFKGDWVPLLAFYWRRAPKSDTASRYWQWSATTYIPSAVLNVILSQGI